MKISGFSFVRNGVSLYYPVAESIRSILPICEEFVVAVGKGEPGDRTREVIENIGDPKIRIIDTVWDENDYKKGTVNSRQSDIAKAACTGDWLFYLQADEVVHERYLPVIQARCKQLLNETSVEGLLFSYKHFWGDYSRYLDSRAWYSEEIRVVRNLPAIHSWHSAQSFRSFDFYESPWQTSGTRKLRVAKVDAEIYHYGWVRPPHLMQKKRKALISVHAGVKETEAQFQTEPATFNYGRIDRLPRFTETHPAVMQEMIARMDWQDELDSAGKPPALHKHERLKYRLLTFLEKKVLFGHKLFGRKNWELISI
jgi:hypothetical protein